MQQWLISEPTQTKPRFQFGQFGKKIFDLLRQTQPARIGRVWRPCWRERVGRKKRFLSLVEREALFCGETALAAQFLAQDKLCEHAE